MRAIWLKILKTYFFGMKYSPVTSTTSIFMGAAICFYQLCVIDCVKLLHWRPKMFHVTRLAINIFCLRSINSQQVVQKSLASGASEAIFVVWSRLHYHFFSIKNHSLASWTACNIGGQRWGDGIGVHWSFSKLKVSCGHLLKNWFVAGLAKDSFPLAIKKVCRIHELAALITFEAGLVIPAIFCSQLFSFKHPAFAFGAAGDIIQRCWNFLGVYGTHWLGSSTFGAKP